MFDGNGLAETAALFGIYLFWAVFVSKTFFHQVWSFALTLLPLTWLFLLSQPYTLAYWLACLLNLVSTVACLALSPLQLLWRRSNRESKSKRIEVIYEPPVKGTGIKSSPDIE
jgi:hypothetical protein